MGAGLNLALARYIAVCALIPHCQLAMSNPIKTPSMPARKQLPLRMERTPPRPRQPSRAAVRMVARLLALEGQGVFALSIAVSSPLEHEWRWGILTSIMYRSEV